MADIKINKSIFLGTTIKHQKARTGNDSGSFTGSTNGDTIPKKRFGKIYEYNRIRKTEPRSTR